MKKHKTNEWTDRENSLLQEYYYTLSQNALLAILPGRGYIDMTKQVGVLKRKNKSFRQKDGRYTSI